ncbi:peroxiredoxin [Sutterella sp.]|uniref:peroxiredoxin n=1 Tax=Sutterella sp. TaxID=1981025 RepID=UPI0026E0C996|nr:peroxiredoxin [Sutterella sp.]MDO5532706.1 peroxiredoxin [Sutterella sp.]
MAVTKLPELKVGAAAPDFTMESDTAGTKTLADFAGRRLILYFYPKDNTSGCTLEAQGFRDHLAEFEALGCTVAGVSPDSIKAHCGFRTKQSLNFLLLSDPERKVCEAYGALKLEEKEGEVKRKVVRSTFVISPGGKIEHALYAVAAKTHVAELLELLSKA